MSGQFYDSPLQKALSICYILSEIFKEKEIFYLDLVLYLGSCD